MKPIHTNYISAETFSFADGIKMKLLLSGSENNGLHEVFEDVIEPGLGPGRHIHYKQDETFIFLQGTFDVEIDGQLYKMKAGDAAFVPKGTVHTWKNVGDDIGRLIYFFTPALNVEDMFRELNWAKENGELTPENNSKIAQNYPEHEFVGPPL